MNALKWLWDNLGLVVPSALGAGGFLFAGWKWLTNQRKGIIATVTRHAFLCVEDLVSNGFVPTVTASKVDLGLKAADDWMVANGWRLPTPAEKAVIAQGFRALNGATVAQLQAAPPAVAAPPALASPK